MFNQDKFANILKEINETYDTMTDFGKSASFDRTYISKYINKKLSNPPTPKILEKIAKASHGITNYKELMHICGYLNVYNSDDINVFAQNNINQKKPAFFLDVKYDYDDLSEEETSSLQEIYEIFKNCLINNQEINWGIIQTNKDLSYHRLSNKKNLEKVIQLILDTIQAIKISAEKVKNNKLDALGNPVVSIPVLGVVKAGYDYLAQENWIGTVDVDKKLAESGELFALKVHGNSMFPTLMEDDIVIIKKQDDFENGDIVVAIINGDEATIKKGKKSDAGILLQPLNNDYEPLIFTYDEMKSIPVTIIGVVKQLKREF